MTQQHWDTMHSGGWPKHIGRNVLWHRLREMWWILTGRHSLHRAWQNGYDRHIQDESARRARGGQ